MPPPSSPPLEKKETKSRPMDAVAEAIDPGAARQVYDAFLVVDVEATCLPGTDFNYANEIIASFFYLYTDHNLTHVRSLHCRSGQYVYYGGSIKMRTAKRAGWRSSMSSGALYGQCGGHSSPHSAPSSLESHKSVQVHSYCTA